MIYTIIKLGISQIQRWKRVLNKNMSSRKAGLRQFGLQYNYGFNNQSTGRKQSVETLQGT